MTHKIAKILPESIAAELGISAGDVLLQINGKKIRDILDYRFTVQAEELLLEIKKPDGEIWELEIEKDADEDLGLVFSRPLMSPKRRCRNKCLFCFVDQQPRGLRKSLYFKDDDARLSFLHGNYVTLTNLSESEIRRLASCHLSPLRISVHTTDPDLRAKIMGCENAANLNAALEIFGAAGISMHFQIVLCKNINDGENLNRTIAELSRVKGAESLAVVPAGITRHRENLPALLPFAPDDARQVLAQISAAQKICRRTIGKTFVFAADEWYIMAGESLPAYNKYEDFPQLDNGVGMLRLFEKQFSGFHPEPRELFEKSSTKTLTLEMGIVTGVAAAEFMRELADSFEKENPRAQITVYAIRNDFFGESITVSGLLTGTDIIAQLKGRTTAKILFLPENVFRANTETMLDGTTKKQLAAALGVTIKIGSTNGKEFYRQLLGAIKC